LILSPFAPHMTQELWKEIGNNTFIMNEKWPAFDPELAKDSEIEIPIMINGKLKERVLAAPGISEEEVKEKAFQLEKVKAAVEGKQIIKIIFANKKLLNIVLK